jgi:hypothetical protein
VHPHLVHGKHRRTQYEFPVSIEPLMNAESGNCLARSAGHHQLDNLPRSESVEDFAPQASTGAGVAPCLALVPTPSVTG